MNTNVHRCEHGEQQSRARRVIASSCRDNRIRIKPVGDLPSPAKVYEAIVQYQFQEVFQPHWFGSIQWQPFITQYTEVVNEAKHFRNKLLCGLMNKKLSKIPDPPCRPRMIWFHEKAIALINPNQPDNPRFKTVYHSHFHLGECPDPYNSWIQLDWLVRNNVAKGFHRLSGNNSKQNQGFVIKPWIKERHAYYNLKDYYRFRHQQDSDLVLDISKNSDLQFFRD